MKNKRAQVFIATTHGLVQIQSITTLASEDVSSVVTVAGSSQLAAISSAYQAFVKPPQGIISDVFNQHAYRVNLSHGIDQGDSWQLGIFLAHHLYAHDCLATHTANTTMQTPDVVFIATGKIDTLSYKTLAIDALAKKCMLANASINKWNSQGLDVCFLVPLENCRQPIPDSAIRLTPVNALNELLHVCAAHGLPVGQHAFEPANKVITKVSASVDGMQASRKSINDEPVVIDANYVADISANSQTNDTHAKASEQRVNVNTPSHFISRLRHYVPSKRTRNILVVSICLVVCIWLYKYDSSFADEPKQVLSNNEVVQGRPSVSMRFAMMASLSENKMRCEAHQVLMIGQGRLTQSTLINTTKLEHLCALTLISDSSVSSLWLVSDSKAILPLNVQKDVDAPIARIVKNAQVFHSDLALLQWPVPLPSNQSQNRRYTLLAFANPTDVADISSLEAYLGQFQLNGKPHSTDDLQRWIDKVQQSNTVKMLTHELIKMP